MLETTLEVFMINAFSQAQPCTITSGMHGVEVNFEVDNMGDLEDVLMCIEGEVDYTDCLYVCHDEVGRHTVILYWRMLRRRNALCRTI